MRSAEKKYYIFYFQYIFAANVGISYVITEIIFFKFRNNKRKNSKYSKFVGQGFDTVLNIVYELFIKEGTTLQRFLTYSLDQSPFEKLTDFQPVKKFLAFYGNRTFTTAFTSARHHSLC